jgi:hypothetical protein
VDKAMYEEEDFVIIFIDFRASSKQTVEKEEKQKKDILMFESQSKPFIITLHAHSHQR